MNLIEKAIVLASKAHAGQFRRDGVTPYIAHPAMVANRLSQYSPETIAAAWLHDVLEDTDTVSQDLYDAGISEDVVDAVHVLTKNDETPYEIYLAKVKDNPIARVVKIADMRANLSDAPTQKQIEKYNRGLDFLYSL